MNLRSVFLFLVQSRENALGVGWGKSELEAVWATKHPNFRRYLRSKIVPKVVSALKTGPVVVHLKIGLPANQSAKGPQVDYLGMP
jgi:hypothetical protein